MSGNADAGTPRNPLLVLAGLMPLALGGIILLAGVVSGTGNALLMAVGGALALLGILLLAASGRSSAGLPPGEREDVEDALEEAER